jgi:arsenite methyltransferase
LSNCVINLVPDKVKVYREILRVLKPGGRVSISDIALRQPLPPDIASSVQAYVGCISGAILIADYERLLRAAGFDAVVVSETGADLNVYAQAGSGGCCSGGSCSPETPPLHDGLAAVLKNFDANAYAASVRIHAVKSIQQVTTIQSDKGDKTMSTIQIYDKPMCCSTGVCGPQVDPVLPRFAADLEWLKTQGISVERYNLSQQPQAFVENKEVHQLLASHGTDCLPVIVVNGRAKSRSGYPSREMLALWTGSGAKSGAPQEVGGGACCGKERCC